MYFFIAYFYIDPKTLCVDIYVIPSHNFPLIQSSISSYQSIKNFIYDLYLSLGITGTSQQYDMNNSLKNIAKHLKLTPTQRTKEL